MNNNKEIIDLIKERLEIGRKEYKQEIDIHDGRNWLIEALEEQLDGMVYLSAKILQIKERENMIIKNNKKKEPIDKRVFNILIDHVALLKAIGSFKQLPVKKYHEQAEVLEKYLKEQ